MPEKKERFGQGILSMALANFDSWVHSPRTVLMLIFIIAICYLQMCGYKTTLNETGYTMHMGETLFYEFNFGCNMPMTTALFLIMVSELPRKIAYQQYSVLLYDGSGDGRIDSDLYSDSSSSGCDTGDGVERYHPNCRKGNRTGGSTSCAVYFESIYTIHCFIAGDSSNVLLLVYNGVGHFDVWRVGSICCGCYGIRFYHGSSCNHLL